VEVGGNDLLDSFGKGERGDKFLMGARYTGGEKGKTEVMPMRRHISTRGRKRRKGPPIHQRGEATINQTKKRPAPKGCQTDEVLTIKYDQKTIIATTLETGGKPEKKTKQNGAKARETVGHVPSKRLCREVRYNGRVWREGNCKMRGISTH